MCVNIPMCFQWGVQWQLLLKCQRVADRVEGKTSISIPIPLPPVHI